MHPIQIGRREHILRSQRNHAHDRNTQASGQDLLALHPDVRNRLIYDDADLLPRDAQARLIQRRGDLTKRTGHSLDGSRRKVRDEQNLVRLNEGDISDQRIQILHAGVHDHHVEHPLQTAHDRAIEVRADGLGGTRSDRGQQRLDPKGRRHHQVAPNPFLIPYRLHSNVKRCRHELPDHGSDLPITGVQINEAHRQGATCLRGCSSDCRGQQDRCCRLARTALARRHRDRGLTGQTWPSEQIS